MSNIEMKQFVELIASSPDPERMPGGHLTNDKRAELAFAALRNFRAKAKELLGPQAFDIGAYIDAHTD